jgi:iron complex transport system substrate-binding protein
MSARHLERTWPRLALIVVLMLPASAPFGRGAGAPASPGAGTAATTEPAASEPAGADEPAAESDAGDPQAPAPQDSGAAEPTAPVGAPAETESGIETPPPPPAPPPAARIITLAPDLAELVYSAGAGPNLVGTIDHSDYPPEARDVPRVGDAFGLDFERIGALEPDLVLAWNGGTPLRWIERLEGLDIRVVSLGVRQLEDVARELVEIGRLSGHEEVAQSAADAYLAELRALRARPAGADPIRVFFEISAQPLFTIGGRHAITAMIELCGGRNAFEDLPSLAADVSAEAVLGRDPHVIIASDDAGEIALDMWRRWPSLTAVANGDLYLVHADLVTRSSTRLVAGTQEICDALQRARAHHADSQSR